VAGKASQPEAARGTERCAERRVWLSGASDDPGTVQPHAALRGILRCCCGRAARPVPGSTASYSCYTLRCLTICSMRQQETTVRYVYSASVPPCCRHILHNNSVQPSMEGWLRSGKLVHCADHTWGVHWCHRSRDRQRRRRGREPGDTPQGRRGRTPRAPQGDSIQKVSSHLLCLTWVSQACSLHSNILSIMYSSKNRLDTCSRPKVVYDPYIIVPMAT
jgi:hypothetical protein